MTVSPTAKWRRSSAACPVARVVTRGPAPAQLKAPILTLRAHPADYFPACLTAQITTAVLPSGARIEFSA